jgi:tetratricopeptide (TPR) repeat protein
MKTSPTDSASASRLARWAPLWIVAAGAAAYANSLGAPFVFDGLADIADNPSIRQLWPPQQALLNEQGMLPARPVPYYTFALNYAAGGLDVRGYHLANIAIHLAAGLLLWGIVRRTLRLPALAGRFGPAADAIALAVAVIWTVHPLQTGAVTYVYQRIESLMGLFFLAMLYTLLRAHASQRSRWWLAASVACCGLGMASKEVMAAAPLVILWYDRAFLASSWRELFRKRAGYYAAILACYLILALILVEQRGRYAEFSSSQGVLSYALTQPGVILHYLRLCFWPAGQCLDYGWPPARTLGDVLSGAVAVGGLAAATARLAFRGRRAAFLGAWFFLILAPTSSILPVKDRAFEHRMYLPLAAVVAAVVLAGHAAAQRLGGRSSPGSPLPPGWIWRWLQAIPVLLAIGLLGLATTARNRVYRSSSSVWVDVVEQAPLNSRGWSNLGYVVLETEGDIGRAETLLRKALDLDPGSKDAHSNLGIALARQGKLDEAIRHYEIALAIDPQYRQAHQNLGAALIQQGRLAEAAAHFQQAVAIRPDYAEARCGLGLALNGQGRSDEALQHFEAVLSERPDFPDAHCGLAVILAQDGRLDEAIGHWQAALRTNPALDDARFNLAMAEYLRGNRPEALDQWRAVVRRNPQHLLAVSHLARALATCPDAPLRNGAEALEWARRAVQMTGVQSPELLDTLAAALAESGQFDAAARTAGQARQLALERHDAGLAADIATRRGLYQRRRAFHDVAPAHSAEPDERPRPIPAK